MARISSFLFLVLALTACRGGSSPVAEARADEPKPGSPGVAVVELFTSEGCSSCPPADLVLADLVQKGDPRVFPLSFHVDYWDDLGWPDRFASVAGTGRQRDYARALGAGNLFTPQMIVGGTESFTGSDRSRASAAIARALAAPPAVRLSITPRVTRPDALAVDYKASAAPDGSVLVVALVERSASTSVRAGENAGKTLRHANVVRAFVTTPLKESGTVVAPLPASLPPGGVDVIAYAQRAAGEGAGMPVLGAARASL